MTKYLIGVDLGGTTVKFGLFSMDALLLSKWEIPTDTSEKGQNILPDITAAIQKKREELKIAETDIMGIGLGVPGAVFENRYVAPCANLNEWGGDIGGELTALTGCSVKVLNDANAAALGEMWTGGGKGYNNVVFVTLGTGVGGGIIVDGHLLPGAHGSGGEIGHMKVNPDEKQRCGCGKKGCLEQYTSATGIVREAHKRLIKTDEPSALRSMNPITSKAVFDCAKEGDALALLVVDFFADYLGKGLACVSCVCDPQIFVIGGGVSAAGPIILSKVKKSFMNYAFPAAEGTEFALASLGNDAGIFGAAHIVLQHRLERYR